MPGLGMVRTELDEGVTDRGFTKDQIRELILGAHTSSKSNVQDLSEDWTYYTQVGGEQHKIQTTFIQTRAMTMWADP